ncbi:hypothetical protein H8N00_11465 [Streptomyces sp. AC563]|uniref:hypothetical protein n=1 Tax=Streptomyces buecherae TaxID=2763006 RepID=UPI00164EA56C|nr:hypothetical protein [Streptomyces buecherae]MBC3989480.1 hypothetical protein [Streptomyces buecherae]
MSTELVRLAQAVVQLEGPEHIAEIAQRIENYVHNVHVAALYGEAHDTLFDMVDGRPPRGHHNHSLDLLNEISAFTEVARAHLNDGKRLRRA